MTFVFKKIDLYVHAWDSFKHYYVHNFIRNVEPIEYKLFCTVQQSFA